MCRHRRAVVNSSAFLFFPFFCVCARAVVGLARVGLSGFFVVPLAGHFRGALIFGSREFVGVPRAGCRCRRVSFSVFGVMIFFWGHAGAAGIECRVGAL